MICQEYVSYKIKLQCSTPGLVADTLNNDYWARHVSATEWSAALMSSSPGHLLCAQASMPSRQGLRNVSLTAANMSQSPNIMEYCGSTVQTMPLRLTHTSPVCFVVFPTSKQSSETLHKILLNPGQTGVLRQPRSQRQAQTQRRPLSLHLWCCRGQRGTIAHGDKACRPPSPMVICSLRFKRWSCPLSEMQGTASTAAPAACIPTLCGDQRLREGIAVALVTGCHCGGGAGKGGVTPIKARKCALTLQALP